ncbi:MAG: hypothetical protein DMF82_21760 [Acidobacteria bacterium]|nr:MAG: hypothetical protein DMF82_21760 [Acidobacteriota bacterium]
MAAQRGPARPARGEGRLHRPGPDGPNVSGPAGRHPRRTSAAPQIALPDLQRLHDRSAQRPRLGLLSARRLLRGPPGSGEARPRQGSPPGVTDRGTGNGGSGGDRRAPPVQIASEGFIPERAKDPALAVVTAFLALFSIVGFATYGLPFFYDFFVRDLGWTRRQVTSGNAYSKVVVGLVFGFAAGVIIDRFGPRRLMLAGILMAGLALVGLGEVHGLGLFYFCYLLNALGYVCGGPLPNQVMLSGWFDAARGRAMGIAYLGIGVGGALVPLIANALTQALGWRGALRVLGIAMIAIAFPAAFFVREPPAATATAAARAPLAPILRSRSFYCLALASICSIGAVGGTMQNLKLYLSLDRGFTQGQAARILSLILIGSIVGRLLMGWLADRWPKKQVMLLIYAIVAATIPLLAFSPTPETAQLAPSCSACACSGGSWASC